MPKGRGWKFTELRKAKVVKLLKQQHTIGSVAMEMGVHEKTIRKGLKSAGLNAVAIRNAGRETLRATLFKSIESVDDTKDMIAIGLNFLKQYPIVEETKESKGKSVKKARQEILDELQAK